MVVKKACAQANCRLGGLSQPLAQAVVDACDDICRAAAASPAATPRAAWSSSLPGATEAAPLPDGPLIPDLLADFAVDMVQGGAGTSTNMNANEVVANRALERMGCPRGVYARCHPNDHVNQSQSTNDAYPTACKLAVLRKQGGLIVELAALVASLRAKAEEFKGVLKMGRTQLQDAVPMTLGQELGSWANSLELDVKTIESRGSDLLSVNLGGTAIGTGVCAHPAFGKVATRVLAEETGLPFVLAHDLIQASSCVDAFVALSGTLRRVALKVGKVCSDLRLLSSGPRCGFGELELPAMAPGSSIMPGKVNPVIPEVMNQVAFAVIGNDVRVVLAAEGGQLQLNVFEPLIVYSLFQSMDMLTRGLRTLRLRCIDGLAVHAEACAAHVRRSIGLATALLPEIGYSAASRVAKAALRRGTGVADEVLAEGLLSAERIAALLSPEAMVGQSLTGPAPGGRGAVSAYTTTATAEILRAPTPPPPGLVVSLDAAAAGSAACRAGAAAVARASPGASPTSRASLAIVPRVVSINVDLSAGASYGEPLADGGPPSPPPSPARTPPPFSVLDPAALVTALAAPCEEKDEKRR